MPTIIPVTRRLSVPALLEINDPAFAHWYGLGVFWAMYGEQQGNGPYHDEYIIGTIQNGITNGWYNNLQSGWFPMVGFKLGMLHGSHLIRPADTLVILTDPDFINGYRDGREHVLSGPADQPRLTDISVVQSINCWARAYRSWEHPGQRLSYELGCIVGKLSSEVTPLGEHDRTLSVELSY